MTLIKAKGLTAALLAALMVATAFVAVAAVEVATAEPASASAQYYTEYDRWGRAWMCGTHSCSRVANHRFAPGNGQTVWFAYQNRNGTIDRWAQVRNPRGTFVCEWHHPRRNVIMHRSGASGTGIDAISYCWTYS